MRKEFKFIRGLYTDKKLFDDDIIKDSFVILDNNKEGCKEVSFKAEDNSETQSQLIKASEDRVCKLYMITPDKITMEGNLVKGDPSSYKFTPTVNENIVDDGEPIPPNVRTTAETFLEEHLTADYSALTKDDIGIGTDGNLVQVTFTYDGKSFERCMNFKASGDVDRRSLVNVGNVTGADLNKDEVYYLKDNEYERLLNINDTDVFSKGRKQEKVEGKKRTFPALRLQLKIISNNTAIVDGPAHYYKAPSNYHFSYNNNDELTADELFYAITNNNLKLTLRDSGQDDFPKDLTFTPPSSENCMFIADALGKYIIESNGLKEITVETYPYGKEQAYYDKGDYYVYNNSAYQDDSTDTNVYLKLGDPITEPISGLTVGMTDTHTPTSIIDLSEEGYTIAIKEDTFRITATEV